jgi:hypothetical protein
VSDEWEETGSSGPYSVVQQAEDALKGIQQREFIDTEAGNRQIFYRKENVALKPGVAFPLVQRLLRLNDGLPEEDSPVEVVLLSRNDPDIEVDEVFFLGGIAKNRVLEELKPHIFFDDQVQHITGVRRS